MILLIGDRAGSAIHLAAALDAGEFRFECVEASDAISALAASQPDLIILDVPFADSDALSLCKLLHETSSRPIVICSMSARESDVVKAFESGADDYLVMPMRPVEVTARLRAVLRRTTEARASAVGQNSLTAGDVEIRLDEHRACRRGVPMDLSPLEFRLLVLLVQDAGRPVSHSKLIAHMWGPEYVDCRHYLRLYIRYLRTKIEDNPQEPELIMNEWGVGYRFEPSTRRASGVPPQANF